MWILLLRRNFLVSVFGPKQKTDLFSSESRCVFVVEDFSVMNGLQWSGVIRSWRAT